jgi:hypothetical protein
MTATTRKNKDWKCDTEIHAEFNATPLAKQKLIDSWAYYL